MKKLRFLILFTFAAVLLAGAESCSKKDETDQKIPQVTPQDSKAQENAMKAAYHIFEQVVPIKNESIQSVECDTANKKYYLTFSGEVPEIKTGNVVVVRDGDEPRIILVKDANISGNTVNIEGNLGDYSFVFYDTSFALSCAPQMFEQQFPNVPIYRPDKTSLSKSDKATVDIDVPQWHVGDNDFTFDGGFSITHKINSIGSVKLSHNLHLSAVYFVLLDFKKRVDVCIDGVWYEKSYDVDWDYEVYFDKCSIKNGINVGITGKVDLVKKEHELIKSFNDATWVPIHGIPVRIEYGVDFLWDLKITASASMSIDLSTEAVYSQQLGVYKTEDDGLHLSYSKPMFETNVTPTMNGNAELSLKGSIYPVFYFSLYSKTVGGGGFALKPTLTAKVGAGVTFGGDNDLKANAGIGASAVFGIKSEIGYYREKFLLEENESLMQFTTPTLSERVPLFESNPIKTFLENSSQSQNDEDFYHLDTEWDILDIAAWKTPSKLALMSLSDENHTATYITDEELQKNQVESQTEQGGGSAWSCIDDTDFYFPIHKGVPIKAHFKVLSELLIDLVFKEWRYYYNTPFQYGVIFRSKYDNELQDTKIVKGYDFEYEWTPKEDDDYLEAFVYDYKGKQKGYVKINPVNISAKLSADKVNENDECYVSGEIVAGHSEYDFTVLVDGKVIKTVKKTGKYKIQLPTNVQGEHSGFVSAMNNGISVAERPFTYTVIDANTHVKPSDGSVTLPDLPGEDL